MTKQNDPLAVMADAIIDRLMLSGKLTEQIAKEVKRQRDNNKSREPKKELLTVRETRKLLKISAVTVHSYINRGIIKAKKIGGRTLIEISSIEKSLMPIEAKKT